MVVPLPDYDAEIPDVQNLTGCLSRKDHYRDRSVKNKTSKVMDSM